MKPLILVDQLCHTNCTESNVFTNKIYTFPTRCLFEV